MSLSTVTAATANPWVRILDSLEKKVNRHSYDTWLKPTRYSHARGNILVVRVPTPEFRQIGDRYGDLIREAIEKLELKFEDVEFVTAEDEPSATAVRHDGGFAPSPAAPARPAQARFDWDSAAQLNPKYTFDAFVIGAANQFAHAAARAVAERPSKAYNPLFLYGGVGMGKTHLMQAIGHEVKKRQPQSAICYLTSEKFTNEVIHSLRYDKMASFRDRFRTVDVLLVDDIQFLRQKERTQEEFFHTFNALHDSLKQIVIASDRPPKELAEIEDRLRSRFEWGLIADIQPPDLETKIAILRRKADANGFALPDDVALFVASQVRANVRELEGLLNRVSAFSSLTGKPLSLDLAKETLRDMLPEEGRRASAAEIIKFVARHYGLKVSEIKSRSSSKQIAFPRQVAMYLCKQLTDLSYPDIGRHFNDKHHSTVIYSVDKIEQLRATDPDLHRTLEGMVKHFC